MEIIARNLPDSVTRNQVEQFFRPYLFEVLIYAYHCRKLKNKTYAITVGDGQKAENFLERYNGKGGLQLSLEGQRIQCARGDEKLDQFLLKSLMEEDLEKSATISETPQSLVKKYRAVRRKFSIESLSCGRWAYDDYGDLIFSTQFKEFRKGTMLFGSRALIIDLEPYYRKGLPVHRLEIPYTNIESFTRGPVTNPTVTFSLLAPPRLFEELQPPENDKRIFNSKEQGSKAPKSGFKRKRIMALRSEHIPVVSSCLCYRVKLQQWAEVWALVDLQESPEIPKSLSRDSLEVMKLDYLAQVNALNSLLAGPEYPRFSFEVKFQFQRLAQNGYLSPGEVAELFRHTYPVSVRRFKDTALIAALRKLSIELPFPGPQTEASALSLDNLSRLLTIYQEQASNDSAHIDPADQYEHMAWVHRATVTPTGIVLKGPELQVVNRVLRRYSKNSNYFLQVSFLDENGESIWHDRVVSNEEIYLLRFKKVLEGVINVAGRGYEFLGFSHSSLRSETCWFMAPFTSNVNGRLLFARSVIRHIGDFSKIRSPAKCAARIGQAFSQTFSSIALPFNAIETIDDIERNGRVFSDGVGTCSESVMKMIWEEYSQSADFEPRVFQIRFRGAKGMISLDNRLKGDKLCLRPSMIKFEGPGTDIEICGAGLRPLPMYLNRQLIKILEDLEVPERAFLELQAAEVEKLRNTTKSPVNAANFVRRNKIGEAAKFDWLIRKLLDLNIMFTSDKFLRITVELAVLVQLRELKHRSRIPIEEGYTLYGIMDETGILEANEVYVPLRIEGAAKLVQGDLVVTRSPALHPGDVKVARAVDVPENSPLRDLYNCIVFSSKGERDIPSQLSGGDLDGDVYQIFWRSALFPKILATPADYPIVAPIDIGREVTRSDMTDFFIKFMEQDQLGRIANNHQTLADQREEGTFDEDCLTLATLHSTAVDFSKTGIAANLSLIPRFSNVKPDFMASGPRVLIQDEIFLHSPHSSDIDDDIDDSEETLMPKTRYYESSKVLGKLYRAIDEHKIFLEIHRPSASSTSFGAKKTKDARSALDLVWEYIHSKTPHVAGWSNYNTFAISAKRGYESDLVDTMITYATHPAHALSEVEVFCGHIFGYKNGGMPSKRQRENSVTMREKHERDVQRLIGLILDGAGGEKEGDDDDESVGDGRGDALERSIACLALAVGVVHEDGPIGGGPFGRGSIFSGGSNTAHQWGGSSNSSRSGGRIGTGLVSFGWIVAAVCLKELERYEVGELRKMSKGIAVVDDDDDDDDDDDGERRVSSEVGDPHSVDGS